MTQRQNLCDDILCRDPNSIFVSGADSSAVGYIFLEFLKNCTSFHALNKKLKDKRASAYICLCCYFVCIAYSWVFFAGPTVEQQAEMARAGGRTLAALQPEQVTEQ